jgi:dTDP-4-amino-4,6-dideoxygalactose transaminase
MIPLIKPRIAGNELKQISETLDYPAIMGKKVTEFEEMICQVTGKKYGIATNSCTSALHLAALSLGLGPGDVVICPTMTFIASVEGILMTGAECVFVGCDRSLNAVEADIRRTAEEEFSKKKKVKAILLADTYGAVCKCDLSDLHIPIISDAAESLGSELACDRDINCVSFNANKMITTGAGGIYLTNNEDYANTAKYLAVHAKESSINYEHYKYGFNYRMSSINAAYGIAQLEKLDEWVEDRRRLYALYAKHLPLVEVGKGDNCWMSVAHFEHVLTEDIDKFIQEMNRAGLDCRRIWRPLHLQPYFFGCRYYGDDTAANYYRNSVCLPSFVEPGTEQTVVSKTVNIARSFGWI